MTEVTSVRGGSAGISYPQYVADAIKERLNRARAGEWTAYKAENVDALDALEKHVRVLPMDDQSLLALSVLQTMNGLTDLKWVPSPEQELVLALAGKTPGNPTAPQALSELVAAGIQDVQKRHGRVGQEHQDAIAAIQAKADHHDAAEARAQEAEGQLGAANAVIEQLRAEMNGKADTISQQASQLAFYASRFGSETEEDTQPIERRGPFTAEDKAALIQASQETTSKEKV